jgi:hypothetical protein
MKQVPARTLTVAFLYFKVPHCELFDRSDFQKFYTIKSVWGATLG